MSELQAALEFQVELSKFYNVDLFQRGYYQIRCYMKSAPKAPVKIEVSLPKNSACNLVFPASLINGVAVSKTFHILYRNEDVRVNDVIVFKVYMLVDSHRILESIEEAEFQLCIELWFTDEEVGKRGVVSPDQMEKFQCISQRAFKLHFSPTRGLHHHVPVLFDYFHLSVMCVSVHGMLLALQQPYINLTRQQPKSAWANKNQSTMETVLFGDNSSPDHRRSVSKLSPRLQQACYVHSHICSIILTAYQSLQHDTEEIIKLLDNSNIPELLHVDCHKRLEELRSMAQRHDNEEELFQTIQTTIAQVCAQNVVLWSQYIELVTLNEKVTKMLATEHHLARVRRLSEAFFTHQCPKQDMLACFEPSIHGHSDLTTLVKNSTYFRSIPPLPMECADIDGDETNLPIIYEDVYCEPSKMKKFHMGGDDSHSLSMVSRSDSSRSGGSSSSPKHRRPSRKKIPKNLKLETLKRPSSMYNQQISNQVALDEMPSCTLVGYRKLDAAPAVPQVELGTLSPAPAHPLLEAAGPNFMFNAVSMPTLLARGQMTFSSSGSLPELSMMEVGSRGRQSPTRSSYSADLPAQARLDQLIAGDLFSKDGDDPAELQGSTNSKPESVPNQETVSENSDTVELVSPEEISVKVKAQPDSSESDEGMDGPIENGYIASSTSSTQDISPESVEPSSVSDSDNMAQLPSEQVGSPEEVPEELKDADIPMDGQTADDTRIDGQTAVDTDTLTEVRSTSDSGYVETTDLDRDKERDGTSGLSDMSDMSAECTVLEMLREEHERSQLADKSALQSISKMDISSGVSSGHDKVLRQSSARSSAYSQDKHPLNSSPHASKKKPQSRSQVHAALGVSSSLPELSTLEDKNRRLLASIPDKTVNFRLSKDLLKKQLRYQGQWCSELEQHASTVAYYWPPHDTPRGRMDEGIHLIICVHGLDGNSADLRLIRTYLEMALPGEKVDFLMSEKNQADTFSDFEVMTEKLVEEIFYHLEMYGLDPERISFVGHSMGNLIIRSALAHPQMALLLPKLYTYLSLSGPHLGTLYNSSSLVNMGMWFMQKWKKSGSLLQVSLKDHSDPRQTFLYKLSQKTGLEFFQNVLLVGSQQDRYVPYHSSRIELCKSATRDSGMGAVYAEMVSNILQPIIYNSDVNFIRYDVFHALPSNANSMIGRAAHIAVLDSEIFIEKLLTVSVLKYFK